MASLQTLEAKMANIEQSLCLSATSRRRKGTSVGGVSSRSTSKLDTIISHSSSSSHPQDQEKREIIMQALKAQLGLDKNTGRSSSTSLHLAPTEFEQKTGSEQKLSRLRNDVESKKTAIRKLKGALQELDVSVGLDIDSRIRQAELEYALGREELQLLSIVEEARAVQVSLEKLKSRDDKNTIFSLLRKGHQLTLHAVQASTGRWNANHKYDGEGFCVDWVMDGEELQRGDRIIEINGRILNGKSKDELQKKCANTSKCDLVVIRKRMVTTHQQNGRQQTQADNMRLQHRISYLEEQVKELLDSHKEKSSPVMSSNRQGSGTHITSISISSSPSDQDEDRPTTYQRGSFVTTIVDGKLQDPPPKLISIPDVQKSLSTTVNGSYMNTEQQATAKNLKNLSSSMSKISISTDLYVQRQRRERENKDRERYHNNKNKSPHHNSPKTPMNLIENSYTRRSKKATMNEQMRDQDEQSVRSCSFESDMGFECASEHMPTPKIRPTPPKKPLRLSLQRAQSLQAGIDNKDTPLIDTIKLGDKKRAIKRIYRGDLNNKFSRSIDITSKNIEKYV